MVSDVISDGRKLYMDVQNVNSSWTNYMAKMD